MEQPQKKKTAKPYSPDFRKRAVRLIMKHRDEYQGKGAPLTAITGKSGRSPDSLRVAVLAFGSGRSSVRDPERALRRASSAAALTVKIDAAPKGQPQALWRAQDPACLAPRWPGRSPPSRQICLANRLSCPDAKVNRIFKADRPKKLWGEPVCAIGSRSMARDFTCVPTSSGSVYVAFVIDVFARRIVALRDLHANLFWVTAWRVSASMPTRFALDASDQAIWQGKTPDNKSLVHHSDRGSQYLSIEYTERLAADEIDLSVKTVGDAYDNALAECVTGLFKTEVINQIGLWKSMREVK